MKFLKNESKDVDLDTNYADLAFSKNIDLDY